MNNAVDSVWIARMQWDTDGKEKFKTITVGCGAFHGALSVLASRQGVS